MGDGEMTEHQLKCWDVYYDAIERGEKTFEVRRDDRGFQKGDILILRRWDRERVGFSTPREAYTLRRKVKYILTGGQFGIEPGFVVMALSK